MFRLELTSLAQNGASAPSYFLAHARLVGLQSLHSHDLSDRFVFISAVPFVQKGVFMMYAKNGTKARKQTTMLGGARGGHK